MRTMPWPKPILPRAANLLAVAVFWSAQAASAQQQLRVALVTPEVVCHVAPSPLAHAAGVLKVTGEGWRVEIRVQRTETDERGGTWIHVPAGYTERPWVAEGCWVPESMVVSTDGAGHLRELADRLVSADALPPFEHLVAVHNLFVHDRYRDQVEESAVLSRLRAALAAKAVTAAQVPVRFNHRPVDLDPRVIIWIESLGDRVRYSGDASGRGTWTVNAESPTVDVQPSNREREQVEATTPPGGRELAIIAPNVACRFRPERTASGPRALRMDLHFQTERADTVVAGEAWVFYPPGDCWVAAAHTAPGDTDEHVQTIVDRFLMSGEGWSTQNRLSLLTVLSGRGRGHRATVEGSAVLGLRRLQLLRRVLGEYGTRDAAAVTLAWIEALGNEIAYKDEGHAWTASDEAYLTLYARHRSNPFAEEILWEYATESGANSCEGIASCHLEEAVNKRLARYWADFPNGRYIARAIELGSTGVGYALEQCSAVRGAEPDAREARRWRSARWDVSGPGIVRALRASLAEVGEGDKASLIARLGQLEECAAEVAATPAGEAPPGALLGWEGNLTPAEGRAESVPEAGGTGAEAVTTPTAPLAGHDADSRARWTATTGGNRWFGRRTSDDWPPGQSPKRKRANSPTANAAGATVFRGDRRGAEHPSSAATFNVACAG